MAEAVITSAASSIISSTINSLSTLAWDEIKFLKDVPEKLQLIQSQMRLIQGYLKDAENKPQNNHLTTTWFSELKGVTYRAQDVIERIQWLQQCRNHARGIKDALSRYFHKPGRYLSTLHEIGVEIDRINHFIPGISDMVNNLNVVNVGESSSTADQFENQQLKDPRSALRFNEEDEVIGFESEITEIIKELLDPEYKPLSVVSLVGMGGIGKTTLARKVSNHSQVKNHFDTIASITVSKEYNIPNLQKKILKATNKFTNEEVEKMNEGEMRNKLSGALEEKTYLIVIDDIWDTPFWDNINVGNKTFPDINNGSRIMLTTRNLKVANHPCFKKHVHEVKRLDYEKSRKLLMKKAFPPYETVSDPILRKELESLGSQLAKNCNGLPLALIVLGGYLSKRLDSQTWSKHAKFVDWIEVGKSIDISEILALSYYDLPTYLKPAFLYITIFPEDHIIECSDLIRLWIAEEFIPPRKNHTLETTAQSYVDQLYERGLVQVVERSKVYGWISRISMHDLLREWGITRSNEEGFFQVIENSDNVNRGDAHNFSRVALHGYCNKDTVHSKSNLRTMLGFELASQSDLFHGLKSLRVISFSHKERTTKSPGDIKRMIFLRYICLRKCDDVHFPSSMGDLQNLETVVCQKSNIKSLPSSLWEISTLRHVELQSICCKWIGPRKGSGQNLQTLIIYEWRHGLLQKTTGLIHTCMDGVAKAVEDMKKIVQLHLDSIIHPLPENLLSKIFSLAYLEVIELMNPIKGLTRIPANTFPPNILKLTLRCDELVEDPMPVLQELPKLVELSLSCSSQLKSMHCSSNGFPLLKYLTIHTFSVLEDWKVDFEVMPSLCHLVLYKCNKLKEFPMRLMDHDQLQLVKMYSVRHLAKVDYNKLQEKGCKVEIIN